MVQIVLRGTRRVIGMRMIEAEQLEAKLGGSLFSQPVVRRTNEEATTRPFFRCIFQRDDRGRVSSLTE